MLVRRPGHAPPPPCRASGLRRLREVHRHRLRPAEHERRADGDEQQRQEDAAERIDVRDRVERQAAGRAGGVVAEPVATQPCAISCRMTAKRIGERDDRDLLEQVIRSRA